MRLRYQPGFVHVWKVFLVGILLILLVAVGFFIRQVIINYQAIRAGSAVSPQQRHLEASLSHFIANAKVTQEDLHRLQLDGAPTIGSDKPKLTIVEFLDYDCPFCQQTETPLRALVDKYHDQVQLMIREFPIEELHPRAMASADAVRCALEQKRYWPYHDLLFHDQDHRSDQDLFNLASQAGLDSEKFSDCYQNQRGKAAIEQDLRDGLQVGVQGTPTLFFNGVKFQGALSHDALEFLIKTFLAHPYAT